MSLANLLRRRGVARSPFFGLLSVAAVLPMLVLAGGFELPAGVRLLLKFLGDQLAGA